MTAEIVILNRSAAVMAADSAVTITSGTLRKTYNSASKIGVISRDPPIGTLFYGSADLLGIPWESLTRMYRDSLRDGDTPDLSSVSAVASGFFEWLDTNGTWLFGSSASSRVRQTALTTLDELHKDLTSSAAAESESLDDVAANFCWSRFSSLTPTGDVESQRQTTLSHYRALFDELIDSHQVSEVTLSRSTWSEVGKLLAEAVRQQALGSGTQEAGIAFAGIGKEEFRPTLALYTVYGVLAHKVIYSKRSETVPGDIDQPAIIQPLGQTAEVEAILHGVHPSYQSFIEDVLENLGKHLTVLTKAVLIQNGFNVSDEVIEQLSAVSSTAIDRSLGRLLDERLRSPLPMLQMVADLPTPELVMAAESLVLLTALQQRVRPEVETVGLPVDVAVASRSDGFIWVRRKQYYQIDLNRWLQDDR